MTELAAALQGVVVGIAIAAPVGPIGLLCVRRTLTEGFPAGFVSGLGAATADLFYGLVAAIGLVGLSTAVIEAERPLRLVGGLLLLWLGRSAFFPRRTPAEDLPAAAGEGQTRGLIGAYLSTLVLTLANPLTILGFIGVLGGLGATSAAAGEVGAVLMVAGIFAGSALWWLGLSLAVLGIGRHLSAPALGLIERWSGTLICGFGLYALAGLI